MELEVNERNTKKDVLVWIFTILTSLCLYSILAFIIFTFYHPDIDALHNKTTEVLLTPDIAHPEPQEALLFRMAIITILPLTYVFYKFFSGCQWISTLSDGKWFTVISLAAVLPVLLLIVIDLTAANTSDPLGVRPYNENNGLTNFGFYFNDFFLGNYLWIYLLIVLPILICTYFIGIRKYNWNDKKTYRITTSAISYSLLALVLVTITAMNIFSFPYSTENKYDLNAVYYSMTQVYAGTPMLVNGFTNTYGLYPHFLQPIFKLTGLNVLTFSTTMSLLLTLCFLLNYYVLNKLVKDKLLLFLGFTTMLFFSYLNRKLSNNFDCYFALFPIRYIVPSIFACFAILHIHKPAVWRYWTYTIILAALVLWNPEFGIVCYLSWILLNIYKDFYASTGTVNLNRITRHICVGTGIFFIVIYLFKLLIYICYGSVPDLSLLPKTMFVFSELGFGLLPMNIIDPWNIIALIIIIGFTYSITRLQQRSVTPRSSMILVLSLISLGYFFYFQGRSHSINLALSSGFCIMLLTVLTDELWRLNKHTNILAVTFVFIIALGLISFSFIELLYNSDKIYARIYQQEEKAGQLQEQEFVEANREFILNNTKEHEPIHILTVSKFQGLYFDGNKRKSAFNPGIIDLFLKTDLEKMEHILADSSFSVFIEPTIFNYPHMRRTSALIAATCEYKAAGKTMALVQKKTIPLPAATYFKNNDGQLLHRKYTNDNSGIEQRTNDALGIEPMSNSGEFSIQLLFRSVPQIYPFATLASNIHNKQGFAISNIFNSSKYMFIANGQKATVAMPYNKWLYCTMNVYTDHMDIYLNGTLMASTSIPAANGRSNEKLAIGNFGNSHFYVGAIAEVMIKNKVASPDEIKASWQDISSDLYR